MAFGGGSARDWQNSEQTGGRSEYEKQSWRDSYNGGRAAGDWTGNTNARLDAERAAFGGATWSGSSSEPSALEWARMGGGVGRQQVGAAPTAGAGVPGAVTKPTAPGQIVAPAAPVKPGAPAVPGVGNVNTAVPPKTGVASTVARQTSTILQQIGPGGPLRPKMEPTVQELLLGGYKIQPNPKTSNAEEWEIRYAEPGEWIGGIVVMASDAGYNAAKLLGFDSQRAGRDIRSHVTTENVVNGITSFAAHLDSTRERVLAERAGRLEITMPERTQQLGTDRWTSTMKVNSGIGGGF